MEALNLRFGALKAIVLHVLLEKRWFYASKWCVRHEIQLRLVLFKLLLGCQCVAAAFRQPADAPLMWQASVGSTGPGCRLT